MADPAAEQNQTNIEQYGTFLVSLRDVYELHGQAIERLEKQNTAIEKQNSRMDSKLDLLLMREQQRQDMAADIEARLRALEKWKYAIPPAVAVSAVAALAAVL